MPPPPASSSAADTPAARPKRRRPGGVPRGTLLVEVGWEVANPVGGIYQVLRSKAQMMVERWGQRYLLVGPFQEERSGLELEPTRAKGWLAEVIRRLEARGVTAHYGRWLVAGRPRVLLLDIRLPPARLAEFREELLREHRLVSESSERLVEEVVAFGHAVRELFTVLADVRGGARRGGRLLGHFHEWLGGLAIPLIHRADLPVATVFTTHATMLGRYLGERRDGRTFDDQAEAARMNIRAQHGFERASARHADVFTTVSAVTAEECGTVLGRSPDAVLPNGLDIGRFNVGHEFQTLHAIFKERIDEFVMGHFFPSYPIDLGHTLYFFTSGRYEPANKGFDLCLEACARLNASLREAGSDLTVIFFLITRRPTRSLLPEVLQSRGLLQELRDVCTRITADVGEKLFLQAAAGQRASLDDLVEEYWALRLRRTQAALIARRQPPLLTHVLDDEHRDEILAHMRRLRLTNGQEDRVKVVYSPDFITTTNPLWGIEYEQFVRGCHLGLFPSAYEPWGYTPPECLALGVPAVTSDLSGFGRYVAEEAPEKSGWAPWILPRRGRTLADAADLLAVRLLDFCELDRRQRIALRNAVEARSWDFDWSKLGTAYHAVHRLALERAAARGVWAAR